MPMEVRRRYAPILTPRVLWIAEHPGAIVDTNRVSLTTVNSALDGLRRLQDEDFDVVLSNFPLPDWNSAPGLLEELQHTQPETPVVIHAPQASATEVVGLLRLGAFHVLQYGDANSLLYLAANSKWAQENASRSHDSLEQPLRRSLIGESRAIEHIAETIQLVAPRRSTVLITGETGTGKEIVARAIHAASERAHLPMASANCPALPPTLLEAERSGTRKGRSPASA